MAREPTKSPKKSARKRTTKAKAITLRGSKLEDFEPLLLAEEKLRQCAARGEDCKVDDFNGKRPEKPTDQNTVRAAFLRYMILGGCEKSPVHARGIRLIGGYVMCRIDGPNGSCLDLEAVTIEYEVSLVNCKIDGSIFLVGSSTKGLMFDGTSTSGIYADNLVSKGGIFLRNGFESSGIVRLVGSKLDSNLECVNGAFNCKEVSLACDGLDTKGDVFLHQGFEAMGVVRLLGAKIGGNLECDDGEFKCEATSLRCDGIKINGSLFLRRGFNALGKVDLIGTIIEGDLDCSNGTFNSEFDAQSINVGNNVLLSKVFHAEKSVSFRNATIGGNLICEEGTFGDKDNAFIANRAKIEGNVNFNKANAAGTVALTGSDIGGDFTAQGAFLEGSPALQLRNSKIGGTLFWRSIGFVNALVDFSGASCTTINMDAKSWMRKRPDYPDSKPKDEAAEEAKEETKAPQPAPNGETETVAEETPKPIDYSTRLSNFTYKGFSELPDNCKAEFWIEWLKQQPEDHLTTRFRPRPWEQLANVLESMGYEEEARDIRIEKQKYQTSFMAWHEPAAKSLLDWRHKLQVFWRAALWGPLVDYGYRPGKALLWLFGLVLIGTWIYSQAARYGIMAPTHPLIYKEARANGTIPGWCAENWVYFPDESCAAAVPSEHSEFSAFIYSVDVALPVVNLRMEDDWSPRVVHADGTPNRWGWWVRVWEWFLIAAGWILSLVFVSAVGSLIRR